jgi:uncharacterized membrane protein YfcA
VERYQPVAPRPPRAPSLADPLTAESVLLLCLLGFAVGTFGTLVGAGGGFVLTPALLLLYPHDGPQLVTAVSLVAVFFNASSGTVAYVRQRRVDYRSGLLFAAATLPGAILGVLAAGAISRPLFDVVTGVALASLGIWLVAGHVASGHPETGKGSPRRIVDARGEVYAYRARVGLGVAFSVVVGFISSFLGIGGGVVHVPVLVGMLGFPTHIATATSHFVLAFMSLTAVITHVLDGSFRHGQGVGRAAAISAGIVAGAQLGAVVSQRLSAVAIQRMLAVALVGIALRLILGVAL